MSKLCIQSGGLALLGLAAIIIPARTQVVAFISFGTGHGYNTAIDWAVSGASTLGGYRGQAEFFTPGTTGFLSSIEVATYHVSGSTLSDFYTAGDNGSGAPGTILETFAKVANVKGLLTVNGSPDPQ